MALEFNLGVAVGLGVSATVAIGAPIALFLLLAKRFDAALPPAGWGALTFVISQFVLRFPWQLPLNAWLLKHYAQDALVMNGWLAVSVLTAALFEETGRWLMFRRVSLQRRTIDGAMFGVGHGGIESIVLVGLSLVGNLVVYVLITHGTNVGIPAEVMPKVEAQFAQVTPALAYLGGVERLGALALHVACSLLVLESARGRGVKWLFAAMGVHIAANGGVLAATKLANPYVGEVALWLISGTALAFALRTSWRTERRGLAGAGRGGAAQAIPDRQPQP